MEAIKTIIGCILIVIGIIIISCADSIGAIGVLVSIAILAFIFFALKINETFNNYE